MTFYFSRNFPSVEGEGEGIRRKIETSCIFSLLSSEYFVCFERPEVETLDNSQISIEDDFIQLSQTLPEEEFINLAKTYLEVEFTGIS